MARNAVATKKNVSDDTVQFDFADSAGSLTASLRDFTPVILAKLALHGLRQKAGDSYAGVKGNAKEAFENAKEVIEGLKNGVWTTRVPGEGSPRVSQLAEAVAKVFGKSIEEARAAISKVAELDEADDGDRIKKLRADGRVLIAIKEIQLASAQEAATKRASVVELSSLLN